MDRQTEGLEIEGWGRKGGGEGLREPQLAMKTLREYGVTVFIRF